VLGGSLYGIVLETPLAVDEGKVKVSFNKKTRVLKLRVKKKRKLTVLVAEKEEVPMEEETSKQLQEKLQKQKEVAQEIDIENDFLYELF